MVAGQLNPRVERGFTITGVSDHKSVTPGVSPALPLMVPGAADPRGERTENGPPSCSLFIGLRPHDTINTPLRVVFCFLCNFFLSLLC